MRSFSRLYRSQARRLKPFLISVISGNRINLVPTQRDHLFSSCTYRVRRLSLTLPGTVPVGTLPHSMILRVSGSCCERDSGSFGTMHRVTGSSSAPKKDSSSLAPAFHPTKIVLPGLNRALRCTVRSDLSMTVRNREDTAGACCRSGVLKSFRS